METMTGAEFRVARERLGVTGAWIAAQLGVQDRTVRRWDAGTSVIPPRVAAQVRSMLAATDDFIDQVTAAIREDGDTVVPIYIDDEQLWEHWPDVTYPASWHRAALGRVAERIPGLRLRYMHEEVPE
ncbi:MULTISPECIES: helix-turn-helix domain-containing protein [Gordonia]|uniref:HTH cro/C1-type domain-containing protein n=1 Tax=Gordonia sihwensis NBRC 108236 TaxID=1223544 RepID=L7LQD5_9ACTN|nr:MULTISPECIES: transcriptional regulator [Gordonia]AUH70561.1 transcriptional regulator [Gordonia sp. YC-JH1]WFN95178.1 transcriptional regulator [Gordonia sihwensis]GAC62387.1 hypothetical protein GSI01S_33_00730 [Gordonia sihwensis NBRC 108236]